MIANNAQISDGTNLCELLDAQSPSGTPMVFLVRYEQGHKPAGSPEGGQFTSGSGGGKGENKVDESPSAGDASNRGGGRSAPSKSEDAKVDFATPPYRNVNTKGDVYEPASVADIEAFPLERFRRVDAAGKTGAVVEQTRIKEPCLVEFGKYDGDKYRVYFPVKKNGVAVFTFQVVGLDDFNVVKKELKARGGSVADIPAIAAFAVGTGKSWPEKIQSYVEAGGVLTAPPQPEKKTSDGTKKVKAGKIRGEWVPDSGPNGGKMRFDGRELVGGGSISGVGTHMDAGVITDVSVGKKGDVTYTIRPRTPAEEEKRQRDIARRQAANAKWNEAAVGVPTEVWPEGLKLDGGWESIDGPDATDRYGNGTRRFVGRLTDGRPVAMQATSGYDDYRATFWVPDAR